jgi:hypothetical protein
VSEADDDAEYAGLWRALVRAQTEEERRVIRIAFGALQWLRQNDDMSKDDREVLDDMARTFSDDERELLDDELEGTLRLRAAPLILANTDTGEMLHTGEPGRPVEGLEALWCDARRPPAPPTR